MKKTIAILLVAIMAVGFVFADATLSGKFTSKLAYNLEDNKLAFSEPDNKLDVNFSISSGSENEDDVYAVIKGELTLIYGFEDGANKLDTGNGIENLINTDDSKFEITEATINGQGWKLSILKADEMPKYATGWETYNDGDDSIDLAAPAEYKDPVGLTLTLDNLLKAGVAMNIDFDEDAPKNALAWVSTNDLNFAGVVVNGAVGVKKVADSGITYVGLGLVAGYENDTLSATVGSDMSIGIPTKDEIDATFDLDVAANVNFADMVTVDAYYASVTTLGYSYDKDDAFAGSDDIDTYAVELDYDNIVSAITSGKMPISAVGRGFITFGDIEKAMTTMDPEKFIVIEDYLSAKVAFDMNTFDVPVKLTLAAMDLINNPYFDLEAYVEVAGFEITGFGGYQAMIMGTDEIQTNNLHVGAKVAYTIEPVGKLSASTTFLSMIPTAKGADAQNAMSLELALENTTLVTGATLKAGYKTANIIGGDNALIGQNKGEVYVSATIEF